MNQDARVKDLSLVELNVIYLAQIVLKKNFLEVKKNQE